MPEKTKNASALPPIDPAKSAEAEKQVEEIALGKDKTREGKWRIAQACMALAGDNLFLHYSRVVNGKEQRFRRLRQFFEEVVGISQPNLTKWIECARAFGKEAFLREGTARLYLLVGLGPLLGITLPTDPQDLLIPVPAGKGKPSNPKRFADCSQKELEAARRALGGTPPAKIPEAARILQDEMNAAYKKAVGPGGPDLLKLRQAKDGSLEIAMPSWQPLTRASASAYSAMAKAMSDAIEAHPEMVSVNAPPPPKAPAGAAKLDEMKQRLAALEQRYASLVAKVVEPAVQAELLALLKSGEPHATLWGRTLKRLGDLGFGARTHKETAEAAETADQYGKLRDEIRAIEAKLGTGGDVGPKPAETPEGTQRRTDGTTPRGSKSCEPERQSETKKRLLRHDTNATHAP